MRRIPFLALTVSATVSVLALSACGTFLDKNKAAAPAADKAAAAAPAPALSASAQEQKEMAAMMGDSASKGAAAGEAPPAVPVDAVTSELPGNLTTATADTTVAKPTGPAPANAPKECPAVEVLPDTKSITYFDGPEGKPSGDIVARASLVDIKGGCDYTANGVVVDIDMIMQGRIGDKGRYEGRRDLEAFMTFPYFVAVMDPNGKMVDKKILATAMRFKPEIDDLDHAEKITQNIPLPDIALGPKYTITVGFQLNRQQLDYNRGSVSLDTKATMNKKAGKASPPDSAKDADTKKPVKKAAAVKPAPTPSSDAPDATGTTTTSPAAPAPAQSSGAKMTPIVE